MKKRGQFFLLAAVIISAVVISLGAGVNKVVTSEEPIEFYDFSYEMEREIGAVLDYEVYKDISGDGTLEDFVDLLADEIKERSPGTDFLVIYGDKDSVSFRNYAFDSVFVGETEIEGIPEVENKVCIFSNCKVIEGEMESTVNYLDAFPVITDPEHSPSAERDVNVTMEGITYNFPLGEHKQVIFVIEKDLGGDKYVSIN